MLLSGDRLYVAADKTVYVYLVSEFISPIAAYNLVGNIWSGLIADNCLFLGSY